MYSGPSNAMRSSLRITDLLKELHVIEHAEDDGERQQAEIGALLGSSVREHRRQEIRRELVQIVSLLGWRRGLPLRIWLQARNVGRMQ